MELSTKLAQVIVDRMMKTIPYNINMMNDEGIIIASGDHTRIGKLHTEAIRVLRKNKILKFSHNDPKENVQPGVNIPVNFHDQTIGVIGITGDPQEVTPFALLLKSSTELLLEQQSFQQIEENKQNKLTRFLFRWTQKDIDFDTTQNLEKEALELNIDFYFERTVVIIKCSAKNYLTYV
ncbi:sugar diacid recognition domain-containing protein [Ligilactobacillus salivarius]